MKMMALNTYEKWWLWNKEKTRKFVLAHDLISRKIDYSQGKKYLKKDNTRKTSNELTNME